VTGAPGLNITLEEVGVQNCGVRGPTSPECAHARLAAARLGALTRQRSHRIRSNSCRRVDQLRVEDEAKATVDVVHEVMGEPCLLRAGSPREPVRTRSMVRTDLGTSGG
jgi:hypothetical protein